MRQPCLPFVEFRLTGCGNRLRVLGFGNDAGLELVAVQPLAFPLQGQSLGGDLYHSSVRSSFLYALSTSTETRSVTQRRFSSACASCASRWPTTPLRFPQSKMSQVIRGLHFRVPRQRRIEVLLTGELGVRRGIHRRDFRLRRVHLLAGRQQAIVKLMDSQRMAGLMGAVLPLSGL